MNVRDWLFERPYPGARSLGVSPLDGAVQFYAKVNQLLQPRAVVLDYYIRNWSLLRDLAILFRTVPAVFKMVGGSAGLRLFGYASPRQGRYAPFSAHGWFAASI